MSLSHIELFVNKDGSSCSFWVDVGGDDEV